MLEKIKRAVALLSATQAEKDKRFKEFHEFHRWCLENIPPEVIEYLVNVNGIAINKDGYGMIVTPKDYSWWAETYRKNPRILMHKIEHIKRLFFNMIRSVAIHEHIGEDLKPVLDLIDEVYCD